MAYVIGSQKGKDIAETMAAGEHWTNPADGSTWKKESDGSVTVTTSDGKSYGNAYTAGGGGNSQYTQGNYSIGSSYGNQQAQNLGVYNEWIATDGSRWVKENDGTITVYHGGTQTKNAWQPTDLSIALGQLMEANAPVENVEKMTYDRVNKALKDDSLRKYAYDDIYWQAYNYVQDHKTKENQDQYQQWLEQYLQQNPQQTYTDSYDPQKKALLNQILNRDDFSYDAMNDPLYQQYAQMYQREGDRAMKNTLAEAAASAGGMNTYAITAAQQANSYYGSQLNDMIPELYQLAYDKYLKDVDLKVQDLGLLDGMSDTEYARYRDTMQDWKDDRNFAYGLYNDAVQQGNWDKQFDYNSNWDKISYENNNYWANKDYELDNKRWETERADLEYDRNKQDIADAKAEVDWYVSQGVTPRAELIAKAGLNEADVKNRADAVQAQMRADGVITGNWSNTSNSNVTPTSTTSSTTSSSTQTQQQTPKETQTTTTESRDWKDGLTDLGLGSIYSPSLIADLNAAGGIYEANGKLHWTNGWDASNYRQKLTQTPKINTYW